MAPKKVNNTAHSLGQCFKDAGVQLALGAEKNGMRKAGLATRPLYICWSRRAGGTSLMEGTWQVPGDAHAA